MGEYNYCISILRDEHPNFVLRPIQHDAYSICSDKCYNKGYPIGTGSSIENAVLDADINITIGKYELSLKTM